MKHMRMLVVGGALLGIPCTASATPPPTYDDCASAANAGWNTARFYVSSAMNRAACAPASIEKAEGALARSLARQQIPDHNTDALKTCFYEGLYSGYVDTLADEYGDCLDVLELPSVARAALAVFHAMQDSLELVDDGEVDQVYDGVFFPPAGQRQACEDYIAGQGDPSSPGYDELVDSVCWNG